MINKSKVIFYFKNWLIANKKNYLPCHGEWEKSIAIREDLIECHWDEIKENHRLANYCIIIPLDDKAKKDFAGYTLNVKLSDIIGE